VTNHTTPTSTQPSAENCGEVRFLTRSRKAGIVALVMVPPDVSAQLRSAELRVTAPRQSVLQWLTEHSHATAEEIRSGVAEDLGSVSTQTVYDVLTACTNVGLVRRIEPAGHPARFERRAGDNHHHMGSGGSAPAAGPRPMTAR
jgi:hypothetical protein